jgi:hypothetical protein
MRRIPGIYFCRKGTSALIRIRRASGIAANDYADLFFGPKKDTCAQIASYRLLKNSLGVLRRTQDERRGFDIIDDFPFMLRPSKHSESFSTACLSLLYEQSKTKV